QRRREQTAADLRRRRQRARLAARGGSLRGPAAGAGEWTHWRKVQYRRRQRADQPRNRGSDLRRRRTAAPRRDEPACAEDVRAGSPGTRPTICDRRGQDPAGAGLGAEAYVRERRTRDCSVVPRPSRLVRAGAGRAVRSPASGAWRVTTTTGYHEGTKDRKDTKYFLYKICSWPSYTSCLRDEPSADAARVDLARC